MEEVVCLMGEAEEMEVSLSFFTLYFYPGRWYAENCLH